MTLTDAQSSANPKTKPNYQHPWEDPASSMDTIGPALNNYKRSPALVYQIYAIHQHPALDYVFFFPSDNIYPVVVQDLVLKVLFRECREKAMTTGNNSAIAKLGEFLSNTLSKPIAGPTRPTRQDIVKQLSNEYGFDVNPAILALDKERVNNPQGLTALERERDNFANITKDLLHNPDFVEERDRVFDYVAQRLTGKTK
jgi:hypothetical protein